MPEPKFKSQPPIDLRQVSDLKIALEKMLPIPLGLVDAPVVQKYGRWRSSTELTKEVLELTEQEDIKDAYYVLNQWEEILGKSPEGQPTANTLTPEQLEQFKKEEEERTQKLKESQERSTQTTKQGIERQQELYKQRIEQAKKAQAELENKTRHVKVNVDTTKLSDDQKQWLDEKTQNSKADPKQTVKEIKQEILKNVEVPQEAAELAATYVVANLNTGYTPIIQTKILQNEVEKPPVQDKDEFVSWASPLSDQKKSLDELAHLVMVASYGKSIADVTVPQPQQVDVSETPQVGFSPMPINFIPREAVEVIEENKKAFENPALKETDWASQKAGSILSRLKVDGSVSRVPVVVYKQVPVTTTTFEWNSSPGPLLLSQSSGFSEVSSAIGTIGKAVTKKAIEKGAAKVASTVAAKKGVSAVISKITAVASSVGGPVSTLLGWLGGEVLGKIIDKIDWKKVKKASLAIISAPVIAAGVIFSLPVLVVGGGVGLVIGMGLARGMTLASMGASVGQVFIGIGSATLGAVGVPIIATLLVFPVVVALILFIINSGAYIVPSRSPDSAFTGGGVSVVCTDEKGPVGTTVRAPSSPVANRAWEITYDLYQGFWCFWNRSPIAPPQYFPNDTLRYPPGYPKLFDYELFLRNPNPNRSDAPNLFWCTWLPIKAYNENGIDIPANIFSPSMYSDFDSRGKIKLKNEAIYTNVEPGAVVFFDVDNALYRIDHVGVVYTVTPDGVTYVQSNAPTKSGFIPFGPDGLQDIPGITVVAIGNP